MSEDQKEMSTIYCNFCRAPLGKFGKECQAGLVCSRCKSKYIIVRHEGRMMLEQISIQKNCSAVLVT